MKNVIKGSSIMAQVASENVATESDENFATLVGDANVTATFSIDNEPDTTVMSLINATDASLGRASTTSVFDVIGLFIDIAYVIFSAPMDDPDVVDIMYAREYYYSNKFGYAREPDVIDTVYAAAWVFTYFVPDAEYYVLNGLYTAVNYLSDMVSPTYYLSDIVSTTDYYF